MSLGRTLLRYSSPEHEVLSFASNQEVKVFSKEAGTVTGLWGAEIDGRRGYIPKHLVREYKILNKPNILVDTKPKELQVPKSPENEVKPDKSFEPYEIIDGTRLYLDPIEKVESLDIQGKT